MRVIDQNGEQMGVMSIGAALSLAEERQLDLVKIAPGARPPVCKLMDYGKYRFEQSKRDREIRKNQKVITIKEVHLSATIDVHDMEVNLVKRTVTLGGEEVRLTAKEFDLLQMFITNRGRPFSRKEMLEAVWKYDDYTGDARTVDVHIRRLREKIERNPDDPEFIFTKWKVGYYFTDKD